jgi:hypothetical protein
MTNSRAGVLLSLATIAVLSCGWQPQVNVNEPKIEICAAGLAQVQEVKQQAAKLGLEPAEVAKHVCASVASVVMGIEAARSKSAVSVEAEAGAGAPNWLPLNVAGAQ